MLPFFLSVVEVAGIVEATDAMARLTAATCCTSFSRSCHSHTEATASAAAKPQPMPPNTTPRDTPTPFAPVERKDALLHVRRRFHRRDEQRQFRRRQLQFRAKITQLLVSDAGTVQHALFIALQHAEGVQGGQFFIVARPLEASFQQDPWRRRSSPRRMFVFAHLPSNVQRIQQSHDA